MTSARRRRHSLTVTFVVSCSTCRSGGLVRWSMACGDRVSYEVLRYRTDQAGD